MTAGLTAFMLARIAEDEQAARAAVRVVAGREVAGWYWSGAGDAVFLDGTSEPVACGPWRQPMDQPAAHHIARWDPERVLAECAARRLLVESAAASTDGAAVLRALALPYCGHPEHRPEWRP
ncbi:DUF6221 family protein [Blastococcus sp. SYSU D00820]